MLFNLNIIKFFDTRFYFSHFIQQKVLENYNEKVIAFPRNHENHACKHIDFIYLLNQQFPAEFKKLKVSFGKAEQISRNFQIVFNKRKQNIMIRELLEAKKKKIALTANELSQEVQNLSVKLNNLRKQQPNLSARPPAFSVRLMHDYDNQKNTLVLDQTIRAAKKYRNVNKCKINWNNSANIMTRDQSPSHSIPHAKRFSAKKLHEGKVQQFELHIASTLNKTGVSFPKANRKELFKTETITPSPHQYNLRRYLQNLQEQPRSYISHLTNSSKQTEHIKGGSIGKFSHYESLYYAHTKKLNFNQRIIAESQHEKSLSLPRSKVLKNL